MAQEPLIVQAIYSFKGSNNDELCFKKGDRITVTQREDGGWWEGTLGEKTGWFPSNYVKECKDIASPTLSPVRTSDINQQRQYRAVVLKDLIDSEKAHIAELQGLVTNFLQPLEKADILTRDEYRQLTGNLSEILEVHTQLLSLIEECVSRPSNEQRVGKIFLQWASRIKTVHQTYCAMHPKAVCILDKYKTELTTFMETAGAASPGLLVLTTGLSKPFRRLDKYPGMLQELERHVEESHPDRGDTQRSVAVYKDIAATCSATRRQKELELQVLTGPVRGWEGQSLSQLGDILHMGSVAVGPQHHDRYLVLFPTTLLMLSVSHRMSAFIYEGKLPLTGITVSKLEDNETYKNAFEITGPLIERIVAVCQSRDEAQAWVDLLQKHTQSRIASKTLDSNSVAPQPPPHGNCSLDPRGYCSRASILVYTCNPPLPYKATYPPNNYPSASPYAHLTKFYSRLVRRKILTRSLLKKLLYPELLNLSKIDLSSVKRRKHCSEYFVVVKSSLDEWKKVSVIIIDSNSSDSDSDSDSDESSSNSDSSSETDDENKLSPLSRQNAIDKTSQCSERSNLSTCSSNTFGFIRYYNPSESNYNTSESFIDHGENCENKKDSIVHTSTAKLHLAVIQQTSENSDNSSFDCGSSKPLMACEDLLNIDGSLKIPPMTPLDSLHRSKCVPQFRQSCPTKFVANKFNKSSLTTINVPAWQSNSEDNLCSNKKDRDSSFSRSPSSSPPTHSSNLDIPNLPANTLPAPDSLIAELLYNTPPLDEFTPDSPHNPLLIHQADSTMSSNKSFETVKAIIKPPKKFRNEGSSDDSPEFEIEDIMSIPAKNVGFRKHSFNSDKPRRLSSTHSDNPSDGLNTPLKRCVSYQFVQIGENDSSTATSVSFCPCCHSPRSSDSGMAGSCTLTSPDFPQFTVCNCSKRSTDSSTQNFVFTGERYSLSTDEIKRYKILTGRDFDQTSNGSTSQMEPSDFESQCRCTSPFDSTPRTSCQPSITSANILVESTDSATTSVTSSLDLNPLPTPQPWESENQIHRKLNALRRTQSSKALLQSRRYEGYRPKHKQPVKQVQNVKVETELPLSTPTAAQGVYRSGMYAHWWMKAKIPSNVVMGIIQKPSTASQGVNTSPVAGKDTKNHMSPLPIGSTTARMSNIVASGLLKRAHTFSHSNTLPPTNTTQSNTNKNTWTVCSLRPSPPIIPNIDKETSLHVKRKPTTFEEDALILKVIEAYCTSPKTRNTVSSAVAADSTYHSMSTTNGNKNCSDLTMTHDIYTLREQIKDLQKKLTTINLLISEERAARCSLQAIVKNHIALTGKDVDTIQWPSIGDNLTNMIGVN